MPFYCILFVGFFPTAGPAMAALSILPVILIAWGLGSRVGFIAALLSLVLNTWLLNLVGVSGWDALIHTGGIAGSATIIVVAFIVGKQHDLTKRLRESEDNARQLSDAAFEALVIHDQGVILEVNQSFCQMYGYTRSEAIGLSALSLTVPEDREVVRKKIAQGDTRLYEGRALRKDGTTFHAQVMGKPILFHDRIVRVTAIRDITEIKQAQDAAEQERMVVRTLIDSLPHRIFYKGVDGRYIIVNHALARIYHLDSADQAQGTTVFDFHPDDIASNLSATDALVMESGQPLINHEIISRDELGNEVTLLVNKVPVLDKHGQVAGLIGISIDITEQKRAEAQRLNLALVEKKAESLREFLSTISHDLKTPLTVMNTSLYLLDRIDDVGMQKSKLELIKSETQRLTKLVQDILTMSQLDTVPELELELIDANALLQSIVDEVWPIADLKKLGFALHLECTSTLILADRVNLSRALTNLIENALHYTLEGTVTIETMVQDAYFRVIISDTGIGISPPDLPHIFESFFRADKARSTHRGGTGLGLAIVKKIADMHNITLNVESQLGVGTIFRLDIPIDVEVAISPKPPVTAV